MRAGLLVGERAERLRGLLVVGLAPEFGTSQCSTTYPRRAKYSYVGSGARCRASAVASAYGRKL